MPWGRKRITFDEKVLRFKAEIDPRMRRLAHDLGLVISINDSAITEQDLGWIIGFRPTQEDQLQDIMGPQLHQPDLNLPTAQKTVLKEAKPRIKRTRAEIEAAKAKKTVATEVKA